MARISSYPRDREVQDDDSWIGTESSNRITRNFSAKAIAEYLNINGKISISSQMVFQLDKGTVSDGQFNGVFTGDPFSAASSLVISHRDMSTQEVVAFLNYLVGSKILISEQKEISNFGHYEITSYTLIPLTTTYALDLTYIGGNGTFEDLKYYDFATFNISSDLNTTYDLNSNQVGANAAVTLVGSDATTDTVTLVAGTNITLTDDGSSNITIDAESPDLASLTQVGIGNVNAGTGVDVVYNSGTATVTNTDTNLSNTYATTITDTATISHGLASSDVIVQLYDITTSETVYADVDRISTSQVTITFATTPTNSIRVLVQKIG